MNQSIWNVARHIAGDASESVPGARRKPGVIKFFSRLSSLSIFLAAVGFLAFATAAAAVDTQAPTVAITSPTTGSTLKGTVAVSVSASDNVGVTDVDLYANSVLIGSTTASIYTFSWNTSTVSNGSVVLKAVVYDAAGNHSNFITNVTVANTTTPTADTQAPTVTVTSPTAGSTLKGTVAVSVSASDNVGVTDVDLYANTAIVGSAKASPYTFSWNTSTVSDGSVVLKAVAYDAAGNHSNFVTNVTVANTTTPPPTSSPTLSVTSSNPTSGVSVRVYPADTSGLTDGTASLTRTYNANARVWLAATLRAGSNYFIKWQKDGVDYDTASTTSVVMDANHTLMAVYETPACAGVAVYPATDSIRSAVALYPAGTTFCIKAGTHRMTTSITARANDKYIGETGAILNGSKIVTSFVQSGAYWIATGQTQQEPPMQATNGGWPVCVSTALACIYPERVFLDGKDLWQVASLAALGPGMFYFDYVNHYIYLVDNPTGHTVEATTGSGGFIGYTGGTNDNVTVKNLIFEKFGGGVVTGYTHNALKAVNGWQVQNNEFRYISSMAVANFGNGVVRNNYIHHNGQYGVIGQGTFEGNVISFNNIDGFDTGDDAGSSKFHQTNGVVLRGNIVANNNSRGLWADYDNINMTYENNIVENNVQMGILHEASCAATVKNNVLRGNNSLYAGQPIWWGAQIFARASKDMQIYGNDVTASPPGQNGIGLYTDWINGAPQSYSGANCGTIDLQNITVHDNVVRLEIGQQNGVASGGIGSATAYGISFSHNTYYLRDLLNSYFEYDSGTPKTRTLWQGSGQDATGTFLQY